MIAEEKAKLKGKRKPPDISGDFLARGSGGNLLAMKIYVFDL